MVMRFRGSYWLGVAAIALLILTISPRVFGGPIYVPVAGFHLPPTQPVAALVSDGAGNFWGTTSAGGAYGYGTVFKINVSAGVIATIADFGDANAGPSAGLVSDGAGSFWGTSEGGGPNNAGTVFKVDAITGAITTVADFANSTTGPNRGAYPLSALVNDGAGNFWGTTLNGGATGAGTVFLVNANSGAMTTAFDFTGTGGSVPGSEPESALLLAQDGLYGTAPFGGVTATGQTAGGGQIFFIDFGPTIAAVSPSSITSAGTTLSGSANPDGIATGVYAQYGTDTTYGSQTGNTALGNGASSVPIGVTLSGLSSNTTYHYQLVFVTPSGDFYSADQTFTTAAAVPTMPPWGLPVLAVTIVLLAHRALSRRSLHR